MARDQRLVFGEDAELYDRVRPSHPADLIDDVVELVGLPCRAIDAGCGTGRAAVLLAERGVEGVGVEPDAAMAVVALASERKLAQGLERPQANLESCDWDRRYGELRSLPELDLRHRRRRAPGYFAISQM